MVRILAVIAALMWAGLSAGDTGDESDSPQTFELVDESPASEPTPEASETPGDKADAFLGDEADPLFDDDYDIEQASGFPDPFEEPNRAILVFNQGLDTYLLGPITTFFGWVTPNPVKFGLRNFFENLNTPVVLVNDMLQLEWKDAATTIGAFAVNSTFGIAGLFEPAARIGMPRHASDFGQTLALARFPSGPYLVLPITGPSCARGTVGSIVDFFMRPNTWMLPVSNIYYYSGEGMVTLERHREKLKALENSSVDYYSVLRSAYYQTVIEQVWGRRQDRRPPGAD